MSTRRRTRLAAMLALVVLLLAATAPAWAQTDVPSPAPSPSPSPADTSSPTPSPADTSSTCQAGQLCVQNGPLSGTGAGGDGQTFVGHDPPSHFARSYATMAVVAFILGSFLVLAVSGRRLPFLRRRRRPS